MMCDKVSEHIEQLEAEVASLRLLCDNQRKALEVLLEAAGIFNDIVTAILSASTMTGTDESGGEEWAKKM